MNRYVLIFVFLISIVISCDAPRTNPLDPENPDNTLYKIEGNVKTMSFPRKSIEMVDVYWSSNNRLVTTAENGFFEIETTNKQDGWLIFSKIGYAKDSVYVKWGNDKLKSLSVYLNALPQLEFSTFSSIVIQKWENYPNNTPDYFLESIIKIIDNENDIDSVFFENKELNIYQHLNYNVAEGYWEKKVSMSTLHLSTLDKLIGKTVLFTAKDKEQKIYSLGETNLKRIIRQEIQFASPANDLEVSLPLTVKWLRYLPGFDVSFKIEIYKDSNPDELMIVKDNIEQNKISYSFEDSLPSGGYYWIIYCKDEFGNRGSSKPAHFRIK